MADTTAFRSHYWTRHTAGDGAWRQAGQGPPGEELAALRRGIGRDAGTVPEMWAFYTTLNDDGNLSARLCAEHIALTLFGVHQQSRSLPAHRTRVGFGTAVRGLCDSGNFSEEAIDRRFTAAATASSLNEVGVHLRGLVTQMKSGGSAVAIDYTRLFWDLCDWQRADSRSAVRRRWGSQYFARSKAAIGDNDDASKTPAAG